MNVNLQFEELIKKHWSFIYEDWPVVEKVKHHRSELKEIPGIEIVRNYSMSWSI